MPYEIERHVIDLPVDRIKINPRNKLVHDDFDPLGRDAWLVDDIRQHGVADPVTVFPNGMLDDGRLGRTRQHEYGQEDERTMTLEYHA